MGHRGRLLAGRPARGWSQNPKGQLRVSDSADHGVGYCGIRSVLDDLPAGSGTRSHHRWIRCRKDRTSPIRSGSRLGVQDRPASP